MQLAWDSDTNGIVLWDTLDLIKIFQIPSGQHLRIVYFHPFSAMTFRSWGDFAADPVTTTTTLPMIQNRAIGVKYLNIVTTGEQLILADWEISKTLHLRPGNGVMFGIVYEFAEGPMLLEPEDTAGTGEIRQVDLQRSAGNPYYRAGDIRKL